MVPTHSLVFYNILLILKELWKCLIRFYGSEPYSRSLHYCCDQKIILGCKLAASWMPITIILFESLVAASSWRLNDAGSSFASSSRGTFLYTSFVQGPQLIAKRMIYAKPYICIGGEAYSSSMVEGCDEVNPNRIHHLFQSWVHLGSKNLQF